MLPFIVIWGKKRDNDEAVSQNEYFLFHSALFPRITVCRVQNEAIE